NDIINAVQTAVDNAGAVASWLGKMLWSVIAERLGLDAALAPIQAIKKRLQDLWKKMQPALAPIVDAIKEISSNNPLASLIKESKQFVNNAKEWAALQVERGRDWLIGAAQKLADSVSGALLDALKSVVGILRSAAPFVDAIVKKIGDFMKLAKALIGVPF